MGLGRAGVSKKLRKRRETEIKQRKYSHREKKRNEASNNAHKVKGRDSKGRPETEINSEKQTSASLQAASYRELMGTVTYTKKCVKTGEHQTETDDVVVFTNYKHK